MKYGGVAFSAFSCFSLLGCTSTYGQIDLNNRFAFPNSDVVQPPSSHITLETSAWPWIWQEPPNRQMYEELLTDAISRTKGDMLINSVWVTKTTLFPFPLPVYRVETQLNATAVNADLFEKKLY